MKIKITKTIQGSVDGATVKTLKNGDVHDTPDTPKGLRLAMYHIGRGVAVVAPIEAEPVKKASSKK